MVGQSRNGEVSLIVGISGQCTRGCELSEVVALNHQPGSSRCNMAGAHRVLHGFDLCPIPCDILLIEDGNGFRRRIGGFQMSISQCRLD